MKRHHSYLGLAKTDLGASVALGNFDGVHLGHQSVIALARAAAGELNAPLGVITFEPHPRQFFAPNAAAFRLMNAEARAHRLEKLGILELYEIPFNADLANLSAESFARDVLARGFGIRHLVIGEDFRFGKGRAGDAALLKSIGPDLGFGVTIAPLVSDTKGDYSSSAIRQALSEGHPEDATRMLGHLHHIEGRVQHGEKRGRDLGFPTINLKMDGLHLPRFGVYAVRVDVIDGPRQGRFQGVASIGVRPMFGENTPSLEVFIFDFNGDLYGAEVSVALVAFQRPEVKFDSVNALIAQMNQDCADARAILAKSR